MTAAPVYTLTNLGGVGGSRSEAFAMNVTGAVVGAALDAEGESLGFVFQNSLQPLGPGSDARGINAAGQIVGTRDGYATVWSGDSSQSLTVSSSGLAINDYGSITGSLVVEGGAEGGQTHAFLASNGQIIDIGTLGGTWSSGYAINNGGQVAGVAQTARGYGHAFVRNADGGMRDLGTLGGHESRAFSINNSGVVAGAAANRGRYFHAAIWDSTGAVLDLGTLGGGHSYAYGLNDSGFVVGSAQDALGRSRAFVWTDGFLFDLNDLIQNAPGWSLTAAYGINSRGEIVGTGTYNGQSAAFLLNPSFFSPLPPVEDATTNLLGDPFPANVPEPSTVGLMALGTAMLLLSKRGALR